MNAGILLLIVADGVAVIPVLNPYLSMLFASMNPGRPRYLRGFTAAYAELTETEKGIEAR